MMSIIVNLSTFPKSSGIYMFKVNDEIVYIGSSKNLYQRMSKHNTEIRKCSNAKFNPALYKFLQTNPFIVEFHLTDKYREEEQKLIEKYKPKFNAIRAYTGLGAYKGRKADYAKEYRKTYKEEVLEQKKQYYENHKEEKKQYNNQYYDSHREEKKQYQNQYNNQQCLYNGEALSLVALRTRFRRQGIEHPTIEAKKYLI